jgi:ligand-binding sensor domain-containing protein
VTRRGWKYAVCAMVMVASASADAKADAEANASTDAPMQARRTLTALDDARACQPLARGGFAVATGGGLAVVGQDGSTRTLTSIDGLPETRVHAVIEHGGGLWVGTEGGAAFVSLDGAAPRVTRTALTAPVHVVYASQGGAIYLGTRGAGVFRLAGPDAKPELLRSSVKGTHATAIAEKDGVLYVAFADGPLARLTGDLLTGVDRSPTHGQSLAVVGGSAGSELVLGDLEGLYRVDTPPPPSPAGVTSLASVDARGIASSGTTMLVATYGSGLMTGNTRGALHADPLVPKLARSVTVSGAARCVATTEGVYVAEGTSATAGAAGAFHKVALGGPTSNDVTAVAANETGTRVAIGTFDSGASISEGGVLRRVRGLDRNETISGLAWQGERLWVATAHGLVRVDGDGSARRFTSHDGLPSSYTRAIHVLSTGRVLVGTDAGAAFVDGERVTPLLPFKKDEHVAIASPMHATWALASSADGTLYLGTAAGLYFGKDGHFERASLASGDLEDDWVTALAVDGRDVYAGTYSKGVTRLRFDGETPAGAQAHTRTATQLGGGYVNTGGILVARGKLYAATMDQLLVRPTSAATSAAWAAMPNAAPGRDVTAVRFVGAGEIWVASRRGIGIDAAR